MTSLKCIAVDDDSYAIENLKESINTVPYLDLIKTFTNPILALKEIQLMENIDILFLDVEMPLLSGIDLAPLLRSKTRFLILITSFPKYALEAFNADVSGYLLKPYSPNNFSQMIHRVVGTVVDDFFDEKKQVIYFRINEAVRQTISLALTEIVRVTLRNEKLIIIARNSVFENVDISFDRLANRLILQGDFIQVGVHDFISKRMIVKVSSSGVHMSNDEVVYLEQKFSRSFSQFIRSKLFGKSASN